MIKPTIHIINGAKVVFYPMEEINATEMIVKFHAGSWHEDPLWGAHHLYEHMVFQGTESFASAAIMDDFLEENAIRDSGSTGGRSVEFSWHFPEASLENALKAFEEIVFKPLIPENELTREKNVIAQEYTDKWSVPLNKFGRIYRENLFGKNHFYVRDGMGDIDFVKALTVENLREIKKKFINPANCVIVLVGKFDVDKAKASIEEILNKYPKGKLQKELNKDVVSNSHMLWHKEDVDLVEVDLSWLSKSYNEDSPLIDRVAMGIGRYILGGSTRSLIFRKLRQEHGFVYKAGFGFGTYPQIANSYAWAATNSENAQKVIELLNETVHSFIENGVSQEVFTRARKYIDLSTLIAYDSVSSIAMKLANDLFYEDKIILPEEFVEIAKDIDQDRVLSIFKELCSTDVFLNVMSREDLHLKI